MPCRATQPRWVMMESSDKTWSTGEGNGRPLQHSGLENPMNCNERQRDMTLKDELPRSVGAKYTTGEERKPEGRKRLSQSENNAQLWLCLVGKVKPEAVKINMG